MIADAVWQNYMDVGIESLRHGNYELAETMLEAALAETDRLSQHDACLAANLSSLALAHHRQGRYKRAERLYKRSLNVYAKLTDDFKPRVLVVTEHLADIYFRIHDYAKARPVLKRAIALRGQIFGSSDNSLVPNLLRLAWIHCHAGRFDEALKLKQRAQALKRHHDVRIESPAGAVRELTASTR